jgi:glycerate kinase
MTLEQAMDKENATNNMISTTTQIFNLIKAVK